MWVESRPYELSLLLPTISTMTVGVVVFFVAVTFSILMDVVSVCRIVMVTISFCIISPPF